MKKMVTLILFLLITVNLFAPGDERPILIAPVLTHPYAKIITAIGTVESNLDTLAYNPEEDAVGFFQVRQIRLDDYYQRTGKRYSLRDMYDYNKAEEVFLYYTTRYKPCEIEKIARTWNGGYEGMNKKSTIKYWRKVQNAL